MPTKRIALITLLLLLIGLCTAISGTETESVPTNPSPQKATNTDHETDTSISSDVNDDPNELNFDPNLVIPELDLTPSVPDSARPQNAGIYPDKYWYHRYHPQVNERVFKILRYPYYHGGSSYPAAQQLIAAQENDHSAPGNIDPNSPDTTIRQTSKPNSKTVDLADLEELRFGMEKCCDLIHQWRNLNESAGTAREIVYSVQLTQTSTGIYRIKPELAVTVKRTIGRLARMNHKFDTTSRLLMQGILEGNFDKRLSARLEKQINDIETLLNRLAAQNDQISVVLGRGAVKRPLVHLEDRNKIDFSQTTLAISPAEFSASQ
jgi:hypothetical protein